MSESENSKKINGQDNVPCISEFGKAIIENRS